MAPDPKRLTKIRVSFRLRAYNVWEEGFLALLVVTLSLTFLGWFYNVYIFRILQGNLKKELQWSL